MCIRDRTVFADEAATQAEIDSAWISLMNEIHKLGFQAGDKKQLEVVFTQASEIDLSNYVAAGQEEFKAALANAEILLTGCHVVGPVSYTHLPKIGDVIPCHVQRGEWLRMQLVALGQAVERQDGEGGSLILFQVSRSSTPSGTRAYQS